MIQDVMRSFMLLLILTFSSVICFLSFNLTLVSSTIIRHWKQLFLIHTLQIIKDNLVLLKFGLLLLTMQVNLFLFSLYGTKLSQASLSIAEDISNLSWINMRSTKLQKYLTLIILRSQRMEGIKAGKFCFVNFKTYSNVCSEIVSYFSILRVLLLERK